MNELGMMMLKALRAKCVVVVFSLSFVELDSFGRATEYSRYHLRRTLHGILH